MTPRDFLGDVFLPTSLRPSLSSSVNRFQCVGVVSGRLGRTVGRGGRVRRKWWASGRDRAYPPESLRPRPETPTRGGTRNSVTSTVTATSTVSTTDGPPPVPDVCGARQPKRSSYLTPPGGPGPIQPHESRLGPLCRRGGPGRTKGRRTTSRPRLSGRFGGNVPFTHPLRDPLPT